MLDFSLFPLECQCQKSDSVNPVAAGPPGTQLIGHTTRFPELAASYVTVASTCRTAVPTCSSPLYCLKLLICGLPTPSLLVAQITVNAVQFLSLLLIVLT